MCRNPLNPSIFCILLVFKLRTAETSTNIDLIKSNIDILQANSLIPLLKIAQNEEETVKLLIMGYTQQWTSSLQEKLSKIENEAIELEENIFYGPTACGIEINQPEFEEYWYFKKKVLYYLIYTDLANGRNISKNVLNKITNNYSRLLKLSQKCMLEVNDTERSNLDEILLLQRDYEFGDTVQNSNYSIFVKLFRTGCGEREKERKVINKVQSDMIDIRKEILQVAEKNFKLKVDNIQQIMGASRKTIRSYADKFEYCFEHANIR